MKRKIDDNPFIQNILYHYHIAYELVDSNDVILDYGCGTGEFINKVKDRVRSAYGYDVDQEKIQINKKKIKGVQFNTSRVGTKLPYKNNFFDKVFMFHILEHVDSEENALLEANRVLKPNGKLILASPYKGIFSWADMANLRYRFPLIHKIIGKIFFGEEKYNKLFLHNKSDLFGDSSKNRKWHKHYKEAEVRALLGKKFKLEKFKKFSLFQPFLLTMNNLWRFFNKNDNPFIIKLVWYDNQINGGDLSYNMFIIAKKNVEKSQKD